MALKKEFEKLKKRNNKIPKPAGISEKVIRLVDIYTIIAQDRFPSVQHLKEKYNVSERTVHRYLEIINFIDAIELDKERHGYKFSHTSRIKKLTPSKDELMLLLAMGETVKHLGTPFENSFKKLMENLSDVAKDSTNNKIQMSVKIPDVIRTEKLDDYMKTIADCIKERRSIDIVYKSLSTKETNERRIDPYGLVFYEGTWILIGYCHLREEIRHFAVDRILDLEEKWHYFKPIDGFDMESHFSHSWGIYAKEDVNITVRFSPKVAEYITRKDKWHPTEKRKILPTGEVELSFTVAGVDEIKRWIYAWIPNVEVIEPEWFRKRIQEELAITSEKHM